MSSETTNKNATEMNDFWEDVYVEALDDKAQFLNKYKSSPRNYPQNELLGVGGVKKIFASHDWKTDRDIALALPSEPADEDLSFEFIHEAMILGQLEHPNILPVYDTGMDEAKTPYFTMKLVKGKDLMSYIKTKKLGLNYLPEILDIFKKVCQAVSYAHSKNIVHLDIKPANILIGQFGQVFLCDWGISEKIDNIQTSIKDSRVKGTPGFLAPEKLHTTKADKRMDTFSLGCLLYYILSGKVPIKGDSLDDYFQNLVVNGIPLLEEHCSYPLPQSLLQIVEKCCQNDPGNRYQEVNDIIEDLDLYTNGFATKAEEAGFIRNLLLLYKRNQVKINLIIFFSLLLSVVTAYYVMTLKKTTKIALAEKEKAELLNKQLLKKQEEDKRFIQETMETVDYSFGQGRSDSTRRFLENSLLIDPENEQTMYNLAKVYIVTQKWNKATELLLKVKNYELEKVGKLIFLLTKYADSKNSDSKLQLALEAYEMGFEDIHLILVEDFLKDIADLSLKANYIKAYLKKQNNLQNIDFTYNPETAELVIKNTKLDRLRALKHLHIKVLRFHNCEVNSMISGSLPLVILDLRNSHVYKLRDLKLKAIKELYLPLNKVKLQLQYAHYLKTIHLPKSEFKKPIYKGFDGEVKFY